MLILPMPFGAFQPLKPRTWRKEAHPHSDDQSEFKDLAQTRGWRTITMREKMYPLPSNAYRRKILFSGFGG
jgi:hypothetical protein